MSFENVTFSYTKDGSAVLKNISYIARQGAVTAIVGSSGGGKSTIAHLIPRFYDVEQGAVKIGGIDVWEIFLPSGGAYPKNSAFLVHH